MNNMRLPSVRLRAIEPEDLDFLYRIENDQQLWGVGITNVPYSRYLLHDYIANSTGDIYADRQVRLIIENSDGEGVGIVDLTDFDPRHLRAELGIVLQKQYRGKGFAEATVDSIKKYARGVIHLHQLYAYVDIENEAALRMFRKCGFEQGVILEEWLFDGEKYRNAVLIQYFL